MKRQKLRSQNLKSVVMVCVISALFGQCARPAPEPVLAIEITGAYSVKIGEAIQLTAKTVNGTDTSYRWSVADEAIASVDNQGKVTGRAAGETLVSVDGAQSGASATHPIVVVSRAQSVPPRDGGVAPDSFIEGALAYYEQSWSSSPHADITAEAFNHWNKEGSVPTTCARCHSSEGFIDYIGGDGTAPFSVESAAPVRSTIRCETCHNDAARALSSVTFPSGAMVDGLGPSARCMTCHQGRASSDSVEKSITEAGITDPDQVSAKLSFLNIHYYPAAATLYAGTARGGYQYADQTYDARFRHAPQMDTCTGCHNPHSTKVVFDKCAQCHQGVKDVATAQDIRMIASRNQDYDGDGNRTEGIYYEMTGLRETLFKAISRYGAERGQPLCYNDKSYPYWFKDTNKNGQCDTAEQQSSNKYDQWTARLVRATYNYQLATKDPGAFAHNAKYVIQLLHDSVTDINVGLTVKLDVDSLVRTDTGHFNGASEAARHWDKDEEISASCARCHGGSDGFRFFVKYKTGQSILEKPNGLECATCHENFTKFDVLPVKSTLFPSGKDLALSGNDNLCATCHTGRASKSTIDAFLASGKKLSFQNVHYLPAASIISGSEAQTGYEYPAKTYAGHLAHKGGTQCTTCHNPTDSNHTFRIKDVWKQRCSVCHGDQKEAKEIRIIHIDDYDGDANKKEPLADEIQGLAGKLIAAMHAKSGGGSNGVCYGAGAHPYFFKDSDGTSGPICSTAEKTSANQFSAWTPDLIKAAHNYQISQVEPGAWAHNFKYTAQLLYDAIEALGGNLQNLTRP